MRTLIVGASHWHTSLYIPALRETHTVVGVSDPDALAARAAADATGTSTTFADWREMIDASTGVELVYLFARHNEMAKIATELIRRGIPLVVEKPAGVGLSELTRLVDAAAAADVPIMIPLVQRFGPALSFLLRIERPTYLGMSFVAGPPTRYLQNGSPWMLDPNVAGGGSLTNLGVHFVDLFRLIVDREVARVSAVVQNSLHGQPVDDHAFVVLEGRSGGAASIQVGYAFPAAPSHSYAAYSLAGGSGFASIDPTGRATITNNDGSTIEEHVDLTWEPLYDRFVREVARTAGDNFAGVPRAQDLLESMSIIAQSYANSSASVVDRMTTWSQ